jgi:hypothetical protein
LFEQFFETGHAFRFERRYPDTEGEFVPAIVAGVVSFEILVEPGNCVLFVGVEIGY